MLRPLWQRVLKYNWSFGLLLILVMGIPRFIVVLHANVTGNYKAVSFIFVLMMLSPLIFLTREARRYIGIKRPENYPWLFYAFLGGICVCSVSFFISEILFHQTMDNAFVYISRSYAVSGMLMNQSDRFMYFAIYGVIGMTVSPIGEEIFYRGVIHGSFAVHSGEERASIYDSTAFAFTHLAHFGIIYVSGQWSFLFLPSLLWVFFMFIASRVFFLCKQKTGSILGAVLSHAGFNLAMMYFIFYHIF